MSGPRELLEAAARCYLRAGDPGDACRCFEAMGAWGEAASLHENAGRVREAALAYERAQRFLDAARCYRASAQPEGEARCLLHAGETLRAAWILAHELGRVHEAQALATGIAAGSAEEQAAALLVIARCEASRGDRSVAARKLREASALLRGIAVGSPWHRLADWALALCEALRRPDLAALVLTTTPQGSAAEVVWDQWAQRTFGEAVQPSIPLASTGESQGS